MNDFVLPSAENAPLIRWFWRADADASSIRHEMAALRERGYGGAVLLPEGAQIGYLGAEWMQRARWAAESCAEIGLSLWLTDDWTRPSGGGELARGENAITARSLRFETLRVSRGEARSWQAPSARPIGAWAVPCGDGPPRFGEAANLLPDWDANPTRAVSAFGEDVQVLLFQEAILADVDRLHPHSARLFLESTHEAYRLTLGEWFGKTVRGFWTTGPALPQRAGDELPWSPGLLEAFQARWGYDLRESLLALIAPTSDDAAKVRQDFWQSVAQLLDESWWTPLRAWCENHDLQLVVWAQPDGEASYQILVQGHADPLRALRAGHRIAVTGGESLLWPRLAASVAALENQAPPLVIWPESSLSTPQDRLPVWQNLWAQGVSGSVSNGGEMQQPYAERITDWNASLARWQGVLSATRPGARIGVLMAMRSAWAHYHPQGHRFTRWIWEDYAFTAELLDELHYDFLLLAEDGFLAAREENGQIFAGRARLPLDAIVIPGATTLHRETWRKLEDFVAAGGKVICLGLLPRWSEVGRDTELENHISQTTLLTVSDLYAQGQPEIDGEESSTGFPITRQNEREGRMACYQPQLNFDRADALLRVRQMMKDCLPAGCETQTPGLLFARRTAPDGDLFLLVNTGAAQIAHARLRPTSAEGGALFQLDAWTGETRALPVWMEFDTDEGGGFSIELTLAAGEIRLLKWRRGAVGPRVQRANFMLESYDGQTARGYAIQNGAARVQVRQSERIRTFATEALRVPTGLFLPDEWLARPLGEFALPENEVEENFGEILEPGTLLLSSGSWRKQGLDSYSGAVDYSQTFALPEAWNGCRVWLELSQLREAVEVWLNETPCGVRFAPPWRFEVTEALQPGANVLRLRIWSGAQIASEAGLLGPARLVAYPIVEIKTEKP